MHVCDLILRLKKRLHLKEYFVLNSILLRTTIAVVFVLFLVIFLKFNPDALWRINRYIKVNLVLQNDRYDGSINCFTRDSLFLNPISGKHSVVAKTYSFNQYDGHVAELEILPKGWGFSNFIPGGDLFAVRGYTQSLGASISGYVSDMKNGKYKVRIPIMWSGLIKIEIRLVVNKEIRFYLDAVRDMNMHENMFTRYARFRSEHSSELEFSNCSDAFKGHDICDLSEYNTFFNWSCTKPNSAKCTSYVPETHFTLPHHPKRCLELIKSFQEEIIHNNITIDTRGLGNDSSKSVFPGSHGNKYSYFHGGKWMTKLLYKYWTQNSSPSFDCIKTGEFIFLGDSNARNAYAHTMAYFYGDDIPKIFKGKTGSHTKDDLKFTYLAFGHSSVGTPDSHGGMLPLNDLPSFVTNRTISIYISIWAHITFFHRDNITTVYQHLRERINSIKLLYPSVKVIIRLPHLREITEGLNHRYRHNNHYGLDCLMIMKNIFENTDVYFIDMWDIVVAKGGMYDIHPKGIAFKADMDLFKAIICV